VNSTSSDRTLTNAHGPEHQRTKHVVQLSASAPAALKAGEGTTRYLNGQDGGEDNLGLAYEKEVKANGITEHKHYLTAGGMVFALQVTRTGNLAAGAPSVPGSTQTSSLSYFHHDHLGSIAAITDENRNVVERLAYDPWGKRRYANGAADTTDSITGKRTDRGYTEHEHLDEMGIIHMNGRVYDPLIGRMMSADPYVQAPTNLKTFNRYAYVWNNPLKMYDPEGYFSYSVGGPNDSPGSGSTYTYTNSDGSRSNYGCSSCGSSSPGSSSYQAPAGNNVNYPTPIPTRPSPPLGQPTQGQPTPGFMGQPIPYTYQEPSWLQKVWSFLKGDGLKALDGIPPGKLLIGAAAVIRNADKLSDVAASVRGTGIPGSFSSTLNKAGGEIYTSVGEISQNSFANIVHLSVDAGKSVDILSGVHGLENGLIRADISLYAADVARFGNEVGVTVHNLATMAPAEIKAVLEKASTIIGGFCNSGACLK
jgi:RHS repeat-associated protein